jgi:hypothetical protein
MEDGVQSFIAAAMRAEALRTRAAAGTSKMQAEVAAVASANSKLASALLHDDKSKWYAKQHANPGESAGVGPLMLIEGVCVLAFLFAPPAGLPWWLPWAGAGVEAIAIGTTVFVSAPLHERLNAHFNQATLNRLIATNWIRTVAWTGRAAVAIAMLVAVLR